MESGLYVSQILCGSVPFGKERADKQSEEQKGYTVAEEVQPCHRFSASIEVPCALLQELFILSKLRLLAILRGGRGVVQEPQDASTGVHCHQ